MMLHLKGIFFSLSFLFVLVKTNPVESRLQTDGVLFKVSTGSGFRIVDMGYWAFGMEF